MRTLLTLYWLLIMAAMALLTCERSSVTVPRVDAASTEAREDSLAMVAALAGQARIKTAVRARAETAVAKATELADAADDPAIWFNADNPAGSLIFGSNKVGGLAAYDLSGREVAYYPLGKINNVDILPGVPFGNQTMTLLGCSNRTEQSLNIFAVDPVTGGLENLLATPLFMDSTVIDDVYGFCFARSGNRIYAVANGKNGVVLQYELRMESDRLKTRLVRHLRLPSQTEGMVADHERGILYIGEEAAGIHRFSIVPRAGEEVARPQVQSGLLKARVGAPVDLVADVEGLTLYARPDGTGYLIASIQGNFTYALFERSENNDYLGSFKIIGGSVDGVEETDGVDVTTHALPGYPGGLLVVQDGFNYDGDTLKPQNFKYVDFGEVLSTLERMGK